MNPGIVIVGGGQAGAQAAIVLRQAGYGGLVTIIGDETYVPYERPPLSKAFLAGEIPIERMYMRPPEFYPGKDVAVRLATRVDTIDRANKRVVLGSGETLAYSKLILATGGRVRRMGCPGADLNGIHYLRNVDDVLGFREQLTDGKRVVIVGGGYVGLEVAAVAIKRGCKVTVLEAQPLVLSRVVAPQMSLFYQEVHTQAGVDIHTAAMVTAFEGHGDVERVVCSHGTFAADIVVIGIGIFPNVELAADAGLGVDNGILVDECARTNDPDIFAAGDCTNHPSALLGTRLRLESVPNALSQGKAAALAALDKPEPYNEVPWFWSDQYDLKLQMTGLSRPEDAVVIRGSMAERKFSACYLREGVFVACQAVNLAKDFLQSKKLIAAKTKPDPVRLADVTQALKDF
jgi:3-phenylpropionate/trans-cinnamate dioxygenase ferredoxin reductase subunit